MFETLAESRLVVIGERQDAYNFFNELTETISGTSQIGGSA